MWPLCGRTEELRLLVAAATSGAHQAVVVSGAAGVGKSRLIQEALAKLAGQGWAAVYVPATRSASGIEFGAVAHLLPDDVSPTDTALEIMRQIRREVVARAPAGQVVMCVDDGHLLDGSSAAVIHSLAASKSAVVLATLRRGEPVPDAVTALWKDDLGVRVELQPLSLSEVERLVETVLGGQVDRATQRRIWATTHGNVLYLRELLAGGRASGALRERGQVWSWTGTVRGGDRLAELISDRLGALEPAQRSLLELLAVGEPLGPVFLGDTAQLVRLEERGLVTVRRDRRRTAVRLGHPLYADTIRARLGALRSAEIAGQLAAALAATGMRRRGDLLRVASWRVDAGDRSDPGLLVAAARQARSRMDHSLTRRLTEAAIDAGAGSDAYVLLADALYWQGEHEKADRVLRGAPADVVPDRWRPIVSASILFWGLGKPAEAETVLQDAECRLAAGSDRDELAAHRAAMAAFNGRPAEAISIAAPILAATTATDMSRARALEALIPALAMTGRTGDAVTVADAGVRVATSVTADEPLVRSHFLAGKATACWLAGRYADMHALVEAEYHESLDYGAIELRGMWAMLLGLSRLSRGRVRSAVTPAREAAETLRRATTDGGFRSLALAIVAQAAAMVGEPDNAAQALAAARDSHPPVVRTHDTILLLADAWLCAARGEISRAHRVVSRAIGLAAGRQQYALALLYAHEGLRLGITGLTTRMAALARHVDGPIAPVYVDHARALASGDGAGLAAVAARFAELDATLLAAEASAQAAHAYRAAGVSGDALAARTRAEAWAADCEGARTPALAATDQTAVLTAREQEIAGLAAGQLTTGQIADALTLSRRTVDNHLHHIYAKLGISSRTELARLLNQAQ